MKIYIVFGESGSYSDHIEWNICAFTSEARAEELVDKLTRLNKFNAEFHKRMNVEFALTWTDTCPPGPERPAPSAEFYMLQRACSSGQGTPEIKDAFRKAQAQHMKNIDTYSELSIAHSKIAHDNWVVKNDAQKEWFAKNYNPPDELKVAVQYLRYDGTYYHEYNTHYDATETELND